MWGLRGKRAKPGGLLTVGVVELGTAKVVVLVAECEGSRVSVIGFGEARSSGLEKGVVVDCAAASEALDQALDAAEAMAGTKVERIFLTLTGGHVEGFGHEALVRVGGLDGRVAAEDLANARHLARSRALGMGRCVIHHLPGCFRLDGRKVGEPEGLVGEWLTLDMWHVHGNRRRIGDSMQQVRNHGMAVEQVVLGGLASGSVVSTVEEREAGLLVIDLGAGTTDYALYREGRARIAGVLAVGGNHVTNDLSVGLRLGRSDAEKIKLRHGRAQVSCAGGVRSAGGAGTRVWLDDERGVGARTFSRMAIEQITAARTREIFEVVRKKLGGEGGPQVLRGGLVLTGGMAEMEGIAEVAAEVFGVAARRGVPVVEVVEALRHPRFCAVLGTLYTGWDLQGRMPGPKRARVWRRLVRACDHVLRPDWEEWPPT